MKRNIAPEICCLIRKHFFAHVGSRRGLEEVLLRCISCFVCMSAAGILKKIIKQWMDKPRTCFLQVFI